MYVNVSPAAIVGMQATASMSVTVGLRRTLPEWYSVCKSVFTQYRHGPDIARCTIRGKSLKECRHQDEFCVVTMNVKCSHTKATGSRERYCRALRW